MTTAQKIYKMKKIYQPK